MANVMQKGHLEKYSISFEAVFRRMIASVLFQGKIKIHLPKTTED